MSLRLQQFFLRSALLFTIWLQSSCAYNTVLGSFEHTSVTCSVYDRSDRCYYLVVPDQSVSPSQAPKPNTALILMLHPALAPPGTTEWLTGFAKQAVAQGHVVIYPEGLGRSWNDGRGGRTTIAEWLDVDDMAYLSGVVSDVAQQYPGRPLYLAGMSSGGMLAMRILCQAGENGFGGVDIAGAATVVSSLPGLLLESCKPQSQSDLLLVFGDDDWILPARGGSIFFVNLLFGSILSRDATVEAFREINGCEADPMTVTMNRNNDSSIRRQRFYQDCSSGRYLETMELEGAGHTWPGEPQWFAWLTWRGGVSDEVDGNDYILDWMETGLKRER